MFSSRSKMALAAAEREIALLRQTLDSIDSESITLSLDSQRRVIKANENCLRALGYSSSSLIGRKLDELVPGYVKRTDSYRNLEEAINNLAHISDLYRMVRGDGGEASLRGSWHCIKDTNGLLMKIDFIAADVTEVAETFKENADFIDALLRSTAVIEFNLSGEVLTANDRFLNAMGYSLNQVKGASQDVL